jgi:uncharacterized CHY-type Zn-finger protein
MQHTSRRCTKASADKHVIAVMTNACHFHFMCLQLRKDINSWVAKYRRDDKFSGKPSYR